MGCNDDGCPEPIERGEQVQQPLGHFGIDISGRFVGDEQLGPIDDCPGDCNALLFAPRQCRRPGARTVGKTDPGEHFPNRPFNLFLRGSGNAQRKRNIVECRQVPNKPKILEHDADAAAERGQGLARRLTQFFAEEPNPSAGRSLGKVEKLEERRLARSRGTGEKIEACSRETKIEISQDFGARAVAQADAVEFGDRWQLAIPPLLVS